MSKDFFRGLEQNFNIDLSEQQRAGVLHTSGPCLMLAVPGGGKTTTLLSRTAYLTDVLGVLPEKILSITFSRASANDMKGRYETIFGNRKVTFATIHSFSYRVVMGFYRARQIELQLIEGGNDSKWSKILLLKGLYQQFNHEYISDSDLEILVNDLSYVKNMMFEDKEIRGYSSSIGFFYGIYKAYEEKKQENHLIDFDDMLIQCYDILLNHSNVREFYQNKYSYIQVDEAQDTSRLQHHVIQLLLGVEQNVFYVADDDQSIYGFRAADPDYLLDIKTHFKNVKILKMEENYRSTQKIVDLSNQFIKANQKRFDKNIFTKNHEGEGIELATVDQRFHQVSYIQKKIKNLPKESLGKIAVLYRNNQSVIPIVKAFFDHRIPFYLKDFNSRFFSHWVVSDILTVLSFAKDPTDKHNFSKFYYKLRGYYISKQMIEGARGSIDGMDVFDVLMNSSSLNEYQVENIKKLQRHFIKLATMEMEQGMDYILDVMGYREFLMDRAGNSDATYDTYSDNIRVLKNLAKGCSSVEEIYLEIASLEKAMKEAAKSKSEHVVTLSTMHSSKGLEWDEVYLIDLQEGLFPNRDVMKRYQSGDLLAIEEERRLCYVAMTRAKSKLYLMKVEGIAMSPFVIEVEEILDPNKKVERLRSEKLIHSRLHQQVSKSSLGETSPLSSVYTGLYNKESLNGKTYDPLDVGTRINHKQFGHGEVLFCDTKKIHVQFMDKERRLSYEHCRKLELIDVI